MSKDRYFLLVPLFVVSFSGCSSRSGNGGYISAGYSDDSSGNYENESADSVADGLKEKNETAGEISAFHTSKNTDKTANYNTDNMRGFDPASEDDMDDNGMTRYMEVNDDEGWD